MKYRNFKSLSTKGQSLIEFAMVLPLMIMLVGGIFDFGMLFMVNHLVQNAGREGARLAVILPNLTNDDPRVIAHVESLIPDLGLLSSFEDGIINNGVTDCEVNDQVTVTITGTYNFSILRLIGFNNIVISIPTTMRYEGC